MSARQILLGVLGGKCEECGSTKNLHLHHKDGDRKNNDLSNIQLLCAEHHREKHSPHKGEKRGSLQVYKLTKTKLIYVRGELEASNGKQRSFDDVILELTEFWQKHHKKRNNNRR